MHLQPPFLNPQRGRAPFFDGMHEEKATLSFRCEGCGAAVGLNVLQFVDNAYSWFRGLNESSQDQIIRLFGCNRGEYHGDPIIECHDSGHPYFGLVTCDACNSKHLLYISFYERQPARYIATFHGAARVGA